jgi:hypothetical protein
MAGLDPAIHFLRKKLVTKAMEPRVKPAGDEVGLRLPFGFHSRALLLRLPLARATLRLGLASRHGRA